MTTNNFFPSRYPIMCCCMNGVSHDVALAIAVSTAGAMPSLIPVDLTTQIKHYKKHTGNTDLVIWVKEPDLLDTEYINLLLTLEIKFVELTRVDVDSIEKLNSMKTYSDFWSNKTFIKNIEYLKKNGVKILRRCHKEPIETFGLVDAVCVKGKESAGFSSNVTIENLMKMQKDKTPDVHIISYGGVAGPKDVEKYLNLGASAVGVGTLFAASEESCIDRGVINLMITKSSKDLTRFNDTKQNAVVINADQTQPDGFNRSNSLNLGLTGLGGHIYAGYSIDGVTEIKTVQEIVEYLVSEIN